MQAIWSDFGLKGQVQNKENRKINGAQIASDVL